MDIKKLMGCTDEKPLDELISDGGFVPIFNKIACIGDSLSSGELQLKNADGTNAYFDFYEYSWGKFMEKLVGREVSVFARGGMTARAYRNEFANKMGYFKRELAANAYIIALGVNDLLNHDTPIGDISDIDLADPSKNADTYIGCYAYIIQRYKAIQPDAKFFLTTVPRSTDRGEERMKRTMGQRDAVYRLAEYFDNCYVIDFFEYAPDFDQKFRDTFFLNGHMSPAGYQLMARMFVSYIDYIIRKNHADFKEVGLMGVDRSN